MNSSSASDQPSGRSSPVRLLALSIASAAVVAVVLSITAVVTVRAAFGDVASAIAWWNGLVVLPINSPVDLGEVPPGESLDVVFHLKNVTAEAVTVLGAEPDCSCTVAGGVPVTLAPGEIAEVSLAFTASRAESGQSFERQALLHFDVDSPATALLFRGRVRGGDN
ncbi:DUF1573 domain-containing protein [Maioricimonas rarisocia]|uniref:DUF1573 domain-containing protein n=1 Tax=Maioricimonas rarisocia TaxID=2528026 RepID=UPI0018D24C05|nr:DUF1573 domain-containing protein [Maioricimonas rarisocia]